MSTLDGFIGKGLTFPLVLDSRGSVVITEKLELIKKSIITILSWPINTRFFLGEFGSRLDTLLEEPNDTIVDALIKDFVIEVVAEWEKRIVILETKIINKDGNKVNIFLKYQVSDTNIEDSFIFPFYTDIID